MAVEPDPEQLQAVFDAAGSETDGPRVMLNLNRYRDKEAYLRYGVVAAQVIERVGGRILWHADADQAVIGEESDGYDEVIAVWYPSYAAFLELVTAAEIQEVRADRVAGLERASVIAFAAGAEPAL